MDYEVESARSFFHHQKIRLEDIRKTQQGSFDIFEIYPSHETKVSKIEKSISDFGIHMGCITPPMGELDFSSRCYKISLQRRGVSSAPLSFLLEHYTPSTLTSPCPLGWTALGGPLVVDLAAIPNVLVAGSPGSGKSTLLKSMIEALLSRRVSVSILDPKIVDFAEFRPRLGCHVESNPDNFVEFLDQNIDRMNQVYNVLAKRGFSSVQQNNTSNSSRIVPSVIFVDEWADVISVHKSIAKKMLTLCQKGRAAGISVVLATQRPSSSILPGEIKANFTGRVALRVSSDMESRIIIDSPVASAINERGLGYYRDQEHHSPVLFKVTQNDIFHALQSTAPQGIGSAQVKQEPSFWSSVFSLFSA